MKIDALANRNNTNYRYANVYKSLKNDTSQIKPEQQNKLGNVYYIHPSFMGNRGTALLENEEKLYECLRDNYINTVQKFPKTGILDYLTQKVSQYKGTEAVKKFMFNITKDEQLSKSFIEEITKNPVCADENLKNLIDMFGSVDSFKSWYYHQDGYQRAYERYYKKEIFENNNVSVEDMVKISPNIMIEALKLKSLKTTGSQDFVIGNIPEEIGTVESFRALTQAVRDSQLVKEFVAFRDFMEDLDAFSSKYPDAKKNAVNPARFAKDFLKSKISGYLKATSEEEKAKLEKEVPFLRLMKPTTVNVNGINYTYFPILRPYSTKLLFALDVEGAKKRYFVTMEMFNPTEKTCKNVVDKENSAMRSDSPYLNAVVDYYLRANGCENVPEMIFYDYGANAVIRPFIKGKHTMPEGRTDKLGVVFEDTALKNELKPLADRGIFITDCFYENFMQDESSNKILIVDNGHAKYSNALRPGVKMIHMGFADLYGRDFVSLDASIARAEMCK